jgi:patatin-like phospholipase/acyl hydrolase
MIMAPFRLLSIDGGGIRGLIPAIVLAHIEEKTRRPICDMFDAIAGTSTGGILALGLTKPGGNLKTRAAELVELYRSKGNKIFAEDFGRRVFYEALDKVWPASDDPNKHRIDLPRHVSIQDLVAPKYKADGRKEVLEGFFEGTLLTQATVRVFVTSYDTYDREPVLFVSRTSDAAHDHYFDAVAEGVTMLDAAMASSAAPTYFPAHKVRRPHGAKGTHGQDYFSLVDGGVFSNNPTSLAHSFLREGVVEPEDLIVSLGTGSMTAPYPFEQIDNWGAIQWAFPVLKMMFDGQSEAVALGLSRRFARQFPGRYFRFQAYLSGELPTRVSDDLDDASSANTEAIIKFAQELIANNARDLDRLCEELVTRPDSQPPASQAAPLA